MKKYIILYLFLAYLTQPVLSQTPRHYDKRYSFWTEANLIGKITGKFTYQIDYQYRRMADASQVEGGNHTNIFKDPYQQVLRPWINYNLNSNVRFSLSPIGYWATWTSPGEAHKKFFPEFRICPQITLTQKLGKMDINQRYRLEMRYIGTPHDVAGNLGDLGYGYPTSIRKYRFRYFLRALIPLTNPTMTKNTFYINTWNEVFLGFGKSVNNVKLFDQNRTVFLLGYKLNTEVPVRVELGYTLQVNPKFDNALKNNIELNNALQVYLIFEDFNKLFSKKEVKE